MKISVVLKANNIEELKLLGSYFEVKTHLEKELGIKLGVTGWSSLFDKVNLLNELIHLNKSYLLSICDESSFKESKEKISNIIKVEVRAKSSGELRNKVENLVLVFCNNAFDPYEYYEKTKLNKFKNSSKLEGIDIEISNENESLENILEKYKG